MNRSGRRSAAGRARARRGVALLVAITLLALATALLSGAFAASRAITRATRSTRAMARVETEAQRALGEILVAWNPALDSVPVGGIVEAALASEPAEAQPPVARRARVRRVSEQLYVISVEVRAFEWERSIAARRVQLILERLPADSAAAVAHPVSLNRWSVAELY